MGGKFKAAVAFAIFVGATVPAAADHVVSLPTLDVWASRPGGGVSALVGTFSSVITAQDIERSSTSSLPDILAEQAGIQIQHVIGGTNGSRDVVDMRGFGATAPSNVLVLVNGRRMNDFDLQGFDFSSVPLNAIERIEQRARTIYVRLGRKELSLGSRRQARGWVSRWKRRESSRS